jgi:hypothetical protein
MVVLTGREKFDVGDADVAMGWMLQPAAGAVVGEREREKADMAWTRVKYSQTTTETSLTNRDLQTC